MDALSEATEFIKVIENRQGIQISLLRKLCCCSFIDLQRNEFYAYAVKGGKSPYGKHLQKVAEGKD